MSNCILAWDNALVDSFTAVNDGYWTYTATAANLGTPYLSQKWVTPGVAAADTRITVQWSNTAAIALFALCNHNLTTSATIRLRGSNVANFAVLLYDSGTVNVFPGGGSTGSLGARKNWVHKLSSATSATYWRIDISDGSNPAGFVSVGRLAAMRSVWQPTVNMAAGALLGWEPNSVYAKAVSGAEFVTDAEPARVAKFNIGPIDRDELLNNAFELQRATAGARNEVVFAYDPADTTHYNRRTILARLRQLSPIEDPWPSSGRTAFEVKELL